MLRVPFLLAFFHSISLYLDGWQNVWIDRLSSQHGVVSLCTTLLSICVYMAKFRNLMHRESKNAVLMLLYNSRAVLFGFQTVNNNQLKHNKWIISTEPIAFETKHSNNATKAQPKIHPLRISIDTFIASKRERERIQYCCSQL